MPIVFTRTDLDDLTTLHISGTLDVGDASELGPVIDEIVAERRMRVIADLDGLEQIESPGVAAIAGLYERVHAYGGAFEVVNVRDQPRAIFRLLRLDKLFRS